MYTERESGRVGWGVGEGERGKEREKGRERYEMKKRDIKKAMKKRERGPGKGKARYEKDRGKRKERYETDRGNGKERYCERERGKERQMETVVFAVVARAYIVVHAN